MDVLGDYTRGGGVGGMEGCQWGGGKEDVPSYRFLITSVGTSNARASFSRVSVRGVVLPASMFTMVSLETPAFFARLKRDRLCA